jgi:septum formation protein
MANSHLFPNWNERRLILASQSPRRRELIALLGLPFEVRPVDCEESWPKGLSGAEIPRHVSDLKARAATAGDNEVLLTSDTVVQMDGLTLEKPVDMADAKRMLKLLSGRRHEVTTAFTIRFGDSIKTYHDTVGVTFMDLPNVLIDRYVESGAPLDKAGAYGAQDLIGATGICALEGSFYTVMGLPMHLVFNALRDI